MGVTPADQIARLRGSGLRAMVNRIRILSEGASGGTMPGDWEVVNVDGDWITLVSSYTTDASHDDVETLNLRHVVRIHVFEGVHLGEK